MKSSVAIPGESGPLAVGAFRRALRALGLYGENPAIVSATSSRGFAMLRIAVGLVVLYDSWAVLTWEHKTEMARFLGVGMGSAWLALLVAGVAFLELAIAASLLSGRGVQVMGWLGVAYGLFVWIVMEHGGDFGRDATDPGVGLPYAVLFLFVVAADRLRRDGDVARNEILALARVAFGLLWAYDAVLKFQPYFLAHYLDYLAAAQKDVGAGSWRGAYDGMWIALSTALGPRTVAVLVGLTEAAVAAALISGRGLRVFGPIGIGLALAVWTTAEEMGGPFSLGVATMMPMALLGTAILYVLALGYVWALYNPLDWIRGGRRASRIPAGDSRGV